jgi:hypothetical protein
MLPSDLPEHRPASIDTWPTGHGPTLVSETCPGSWCGECCCLLCCACVEAVDEKKSSAHTAQQLVLVSVNGDYVTGKDTGIVCFRFLVVFAGYLIYPIILVKLLIRKKCINYLFDKTQHLLLFILMDPVTDEVFLVDFEYWREIYICTAICAKQFNSIFIACFSHIWTQKYINYGYFMQERERERAPLRIRGCACHIKLDTYLNILMCPSISS